MESVIVFVAAVFAVLVIALWRKTRAEIREGPSDGGDAGRGPLDQADPLTIDESYVPGRGLPGGPIGPVGPGLGGGR